MMKFLLLDADGVAVMPREKYFSDRYAEEFGVSRDLIMPFFRNEFTECLTGKRDLREVLESKHLLEKWQWSGTFDELLAYWWAGENKRNEVVLDIVKDLRAKGIPCYLATDQEKYRAKYLMEGIGLGQDFDGAFFSCNLGARKTDSEYWRKIFEALGNPDSASVSFWDDEEENVVAAEQVGIDVHLFVNTEEFKNFCQKF